MCSNTAIISSLRDRKMGLNCVQNREILGGEKRGGDEEARAFKYVHCTLINKCSEEKLAYSKLRLPTKIYDSSK